MKYIKILLLISYFWVFFCRDGFGYQVKTAHPRLFDNSLFSFSPQEKQKEKICAALVDEANFWIGAPEKKLCLDRNDYPTYTKLYSFVYLITKDEKYYKKAESLVSYIRALPFSNDDYDVLLQLEALAYFYDLCHEQLNDSIKSDLRKAVFDRIKALDGLLRMNNFGGGHANYANRTTAYAAIAVYGDMDWAGEYIELTRNNFVNGFWPFYRYLAEEDGGFHMWWEYSRYYLFENLEFLYVWKKATGEDLFKDNQWLQKTPDYLFYGLRGDKTYWGTGDNHARSAGSYDRNLFRFLAHQYQNGYAKYMSENIERPAKWPDINELLSDLMWDMDTVTAKPLDTLPLVKEFRRVGVYVFREGWKDDSVAAMFKCTPSYFLNHSHRDANSFEIWYKNDLAIDSGYYDYYFSRHWFNYYIRTIAHNTVLIYDPAERIADWDKLESNDGGQHYSQSPHEQPYDVNDLKNPIFHITDSQLIENTEDYALAVGDATKAYSPHKCELFRRYFLFFKKVANWNHPIIVVFDRIISTKPEFEKIWLLHSINKPQLNGNLITITNGEGKLWCYVAQPDNFEINLVGSEGREFEVNGINYPVDTTKKDEVRKWAGAWRVELRDKEPKKEVYFLNVLIPTETHNATMPKVQKIKNGVKVGNWEIVFENEQFKVNKVDF